MATRNPAQPLPLTKGTKIIDSDGTANEYFLRYLIQLNTGFTGVIVTAPISGGGATGTMTFQNGRVVSEVPAT